MTDLSRIGWIGLGAMGAPMAGRLSQAGYRVVVADSSPAAIESFKLHHPSAVAGDTERLARCGVLVLMLPNGGAVREVMLGTGGQLERMAPGSVVIDMGSSDPAGTVELAATAEARRVDVLDAPVSGGVARAEAGSLAVMVGGRESVLTDVQGLFAPLSSSVTYLGGHGVGHAVKALNNLLSAVGLVAAAEVLTVGAKFGVSPATMLELLNQSSGSNNATLTKIGPFVLTRSFSSGFRADLMIKDLRTALELAAQQGVATSVSTETLRYCERAFEGLAPAADHTEVVKAIEIQAGLTLTGAPATKS